MGKNPENSNEYATKYLGQTVLVEIDRPIGTQHPKHPEIIYPINYGFIPNTVAPDGEGIDAYILDISKPIQKFEGSCIAVVHRTDEDDDKLILVSSKDKQYSDEEILKIIYFQEQFHTSEIIRKIIQKEKSDGKD